MSRTATGGVARLILIFFLWSSLFPPISAAAAAADKRGGIIEVEHEEALKHRLTKPVLIHEQLPPRHTSLNFTLRVIVDPSGKVESAKALYLQPSNEWGADQVEAAEKQERFRPFTRKGAAVEVQFEDVAWIVPPVEWASPRVPFPEIHNWDSVRIGLLRTGCYGACPSYSVEIQGNGPVLFNGEQNVLITGHHRGQISREAVADLVTMFRNADYFSLKDEYVAMITDLPTVFTSIEFDGHKKSVKDYVGFAAGMPGIVDELEGRIEQIAGTDKWIRETPETAPSLLAEHWDFRANTPENLSLRDNIIQQGSTRLVNVFIEHEPPAGNQIPTAVSAAAAVGNTALVARFIGNGQNLSQSQLTCALSAAARSGSLSTVLLLIAKGADPTGSSWCDSKNKYPPLVAAAESGNPAVVHEILKYHPDVNARDAMGETALLAVFRSWPQLHVLDILAALIRAGADVNVRTEEEYDPAPIFKACDLDDGPSSEAISILVKAGADVNARGQFGDTPLMSCADPEELKALIAGGADLSLRNNLGETALEEALREGDNEKAAVLQTVKPQRLRRTGTNP